MSTGANPTVYYVVAAIVVIAIVVAIVLAMRAARSRELEKRFGPEYERAVREKGDRAAAERELGARQARVKKFHIEELPAGAKERYDEEWRTVQTRFVDAPQAAVVDADHLVASVMRDRGYPLEKFDQRAADISTDHPHVVEDYRVAHGIALRGERSEVSTEDLRRAMQRYRTLFDDLLGAESNV
ncbi:MAG TPA: hypothetical protein VFE36_09220 [Candidatus Baltobacteraceae bacterium]|jgi:hypothetical protein|nr:hypothetical protein [Candidatus Baltobacteraceae bacterium]